MVPVIVECRRVGLEGGGRWHGDTLSMRERAAVSRRVVMSSAPSAPAIVHTYIIYILYIHALYHTIQNTGHTGHMNHLFTLLHFTVTTIIVVKTNMHWGLEKLRQINVGEGLDA